MPRLVSTAEGYQYWIPDAVEAEGNPLYQPQPQYNEDSKSFSLPVDPNDITGLPTFPVQQNLKPVGDRRGKEEKLAEMFGVVPGPEGPLDIVKSFVSGLTAPGEVAKGEVEQQTTPKFKTKAEAEKYVKENDVGQKVWTIKLTPELKKHALEKGFSLFSTTPVLVPIDHDPFKPKLTPVDFNPFE